MDKSAWCAVADQEHVVIVGVGSVRKIRSKQFRVLVVIDSKEFDALLFTGFSRSQ